jgi:hypothetical protein
MRLRCNFARDVFLNRRRLQLLRVLRQWWDWMWSMSMSMGMLLLLLRLWRDYRAARASEKDASCLSGSGSVGIERCLVVADSGAGGGGR